MTDTRNNPFFIVGCGRSGSTMLRLMLNNHSKLYVPGESYFIYMLFNHWIPGMDDSKLENFYDKLINIPPPPEQAIVDDLGWNHDELRTFVYSSRASSFADLTRGLFEYGMKRSGKLIWGDKTPRYVMYLPLITRLFPESKIIHLVRDGRDVALSLMHFDTGPDELLGAAFVWRKRVAKAQQFHSSHPSFPFTNVRYEDLVTNPISTLKNVCEFLKVDYEPQMLEFHRHVESSSFGHELLKREVTSKRVERWKREMNTNNVVMFDAVAGSFLNIYRYPRGRYAKRYLFTFVYAKAWLIIQLIKQNIFSVKQSWLWIQKRILQTVLRERGA